MVNRVKIAVALGMATAVVSFFPIVELMVTGCTSDSSCSLSGRILGAVLVACALGLSVAWVAEKLLDRTRER